MNIPSLLVGTAVFLIVAMSSCDRSGFVAEEESEDLHVIMAGHLYSLYTKNRSEAEGPGILTADWLHLFASEIEKTEPDAVFLLGDITRFSTEEEWQLVDEALGGVSSAIYRVPGNHDYRNVENFRRHGGLGNSVAIIKGCKFITLDNKCVLEKKDLAFLDRELADAKEYRHVFVATHYCMINWSDAQPGQDPHEPYPGVSNWNKEVVPRLAGVVDYVFCGDHSPGGPTRYEQTYDGKTINYIMTSFVFRRGETDETNGEGINVYLELIVRGEDVQILPRALPIPITDSWYRNFSVIKTWTLHSVPDAWVWTPASWKLVGKGAASGFEFSDGPGGFQLTVSREKLTTKIDYSQWREEKAKSLAREFPQMRSISGGDLLIWHHPARWETVIVDPADLNTRRFYCSFVHEGEIWAITAMGPAPKDLVKNKDDWFGHMLRFVAGMKTRAGLSAH